MVHLPLLLKTQRYSKVCQLLLRFAIQNNAPGDKRSKSPLHYIISPPYHIITFPHMHTLSSFYYLPLGTKGNHTTLLYPTLPSPTLPYPTISSSSLPYHHLFSHTHVSTSHHILNRPWETISLTQSHTPSLVHLLTYTFSYTPFTHHLTHRHIVTHSRFHHLPYPQQALGNYLSNPLEADNYDACALITAHGKSLVSVYDDILVDVGTADTFYKQGQLLPEAFAQACAGVSKQSSIIVLSPTHLLVI